MAFVPPPAPHPDAENIAGHDVVPVSHDELMRRHYAETGGAPLWENSMEPNPEAVQHARQAQQQGILEDEVDGLTPHWMKDRKNVPPSPDPVPAPRDLTEGNTPKVDMGDMKTAADAIGLLNRQAVQAEADGNIVGARALREAMENMASASEMQRKYEPKEDHPILQKLKGNLGLEKIKPIRKEWAGLFWNCYPSNTVLDAWFFENQWDDRGNFAQLKLATYCVGIDDVPLYQVFSVPLEHTHNVVGEDGTIREVTIKPYRKYCKVCGIEVEVAVESCNNCGANQDPFAVPLSLRLHCAEKLYTFFQEDFGPTEKLEVLVGQLRMEGLKDRIVDGAELYPLAMLSEKAPKTDSSQSGEGPLPEQESSPQTPEQ
jgi:hypothetical protein